MSEPALTASELLRWNEATAERWKALLAVHPEGLDIPCDVYAAGSVRGLLRHIFAVEIRYAQRLSGEPVTPYEEIPDASAEMLFDLHDTALAKFRALLADASIDWEEKLEFTTVSMGTRKASRKTILFHALLHGIRHYAQLASVVRKHGIKPDWGMDYLVMGME